jgi:hypothetical protein
MLRIMLNDFQSNAILKIEILFFVFLLFNFHFKTLVT